MHAVGGVPFLQETKPSDVPGFSCIFAALVLKFTLQVTLFGKKGRPFLGLATGVHQAANSMYHDINIKNDRPGDDGTLRSV